jgi:hypothetical protein
MIEVRVRGLVASGLKPARGREDNLTGIVDVLVARCSYQNNQEKSSAQRLRAREASSKVFEKSSRTEARSGVFKHFFLASRALATLCRVPRK